MSDDRLVASTTDVLWSLRLRQRESWQRGEPLTVEALVAASDSTPLADEAFLELILSEFQLREEFGERPSVEEYVRRFPQRQQQLERLFAVCAAMDNTVSGQAADQPTDSESPLREVSREQVSRTAPGVASPGTAAQPIEERMLGSYRLLEKIGEGGMGAVYKARHQKLKKVVSIKLLPQHLTSDAALTARFQREMESVGALDHPNIVRAMDAGEVEGTHFLVMEFVDGDDLAKTVKARGPLPVDEACAVIEQAADALQHAHDHGLVHRDIKPSNLMWTRDKQVKVLDLGLARCQLEAQLTAESELTESGQALGTIDYMSPEQARDSKGVDGRADIYSLGCTLYFLLTGQPLYARRGRVEKLFAHRDDPIPSLVTARGDVPAELDRVYQRMVAKRPEDRYASMTEVLRALEALRFNGVAELTPQTKATNNVAQSGSHSATALLDANSGGGHSATDRTIIGELPLPPSAPPPRTRSWLWAVGFGGVAALLAAIIFTLKTPDGTIIVEINELDASVEVLSDKNQIEVTRQSDSKPITISLDPGKHRLKVTKDGFELFTEEFSIESKGTKTISAKLVATLVAKSGWHGWPVDAPKPAIAPFNAEQAQQHQEAWAKYLGVPVEYTNTLGMKFRLIPPGEFTMGSTPSEIEAALKFVSPDDAGLREHMTSEGPQHQVVLTQPIYLGAHEVTQAQYKRVMGQNPSYFAPMGSGKDAVTGTDTDNFPVETVDWNDAAEFCAKLCQQEQLKPHYFRAGETVAPLDGTGYRLPTEAEWEFACRAGTTTKYWSGAKDEDLPQAGWLGSTSVGRTHAVGELKGNPFGLFDIHGNVWEWVQDWWKPTDYAQFQGKSATDPSGPSIGGFKRAIRGGCWDTNARDCRASYRLAGVPTYRLHSIGFRVALPVDAVRQALKLTAPAMPKAVATTPSASTSDPEKLPGKFTNSLGMEFVLVGKGTAWLGGGNGQQGEKKVEMTEEFYLGVYEVTQAEWEAVTGLTPSGFSRTGGGKNAVKDISDADLKRFPIEQVTWDDAQLFVEGLNKRVPEAGWIYRLPKADEWEYACRGGPLSNKFDSAYDFYFDKPTNQLLPDQANFEDDKGLKRTCKVGSYEPNRLGLYDMHGNVWEWCDYAEKGADGASQRVNRGGCWHGDSGYCRASFRGTSLPSARDNYLGLRLARVPVGPALPKHSKASVKEASTSKDAAKVERDIAKRLIELGASIDVVVANVERRVDRLDDLPEEEFHVSSVNGGVQGKLKEALVEWNRLPHLKHVRLGQSGATDADLRLLGECTELVELDVGECPTITDEGVVHLKQLKKLEQLGLLGSQLTDHGLDELRVLTGLRVLQISGTKVTDASMPLISPFRELRTLSIENTRTTDAGLAKLIALEHLDNLHLAATDMTDRGIDDILKFRDLQVLYLSNHVTNDGVKKLLTAPHLRKQLTRFGFSGNRQITDEICGVLVECQAIQGLWLQETQISDAGLKQLSGLTTLGEIWLTGSKVTAAGVEAFRKARPECGISWDPNDVANPTPARPAPAKPNSANANMSQRNLGPSQNNLPRPAVRDELTNSLGMKLRKIPAGDFQMGAAESDADARDVERPAHRVKVSKPFFLGVHEVTQAQFSAIMDTNPSQWTSEGDAEPQSARSQAAVVNKTYRNHPIDSVLWTDANEFCERLGKKENRRYRLPTEAEWEYACRAGTTARYPTGEDSADVFKIANVGGNPLNPKRPLPVGSLAPNAWGLFDMNGNVREWCSDWLGDYEAATVTDPKGSSSGKVHVVRGGCYHYRAEDGRSTTRFGLEDGHARNRGFRVVLEVGDAPNAVAPPREVPPAPAKE